MTAGFGPQESRPRIAVVIPTRNEVSYAPTLVKELLAKPFALTIWIMDDGSTDGTIEALRPIAASDSRLRVVQRTGPRGYGIACADGLQQALSAGAELVVQMDGDGSHDPSHLDALIAAAADADIVIGSRYVRGVAVVHWSLSRLILSAGANRYVRFLTGLRATDCTSGYRLWRASALAELDLATIHARGYGFLVETLFLAVRHGARVTEVPIVYFERHGGKSKMSLMVMVESALVPWRLLPRRLLATGRVRRETEASSH